MTHRSLRRTPFFLLFPLLATATGSCTSHPSHSSPGPDDERLVALRVPVGAQNEALRLRDMGFDVVEGTEHGPSLDIIATRSEMDRLHELGYQAELTGVGAPLKSAGTDALGYPTLSEMLDTLHAIETQYPDIAKVVDLTEKYGAPLTANGRHLFALKISDNVAQDEDEPTYLLVSNHHARELGPPVVAMLAAEKLTKQYATDERIKRAVDSTEIWIAPTWNPDGLEHVHTVDNFWRKNRRPNTGGSFGVDLNRNYPFLWESSCTGDTSPNSDVYKGPGAASEPETQTMVAWSTDRHFSKVLDFHSSGREVLVNYSCSNFALTDYFQTIGTELSHQMGYDGSTRRPSSQGEHPDWQLGHLSNLAFLVEINTQFQPPYASAQAEAEQIWPGVLWHLERPTPLSGHVTDAQTGAALAANVLVKEVLYTQGEKNSSGGAFGRYQAYLPAGNYTVEFSAQGYQSESRTVTITANGEATLDVALTAL